MKYLFRFTVSVIGEVYCYNGYSTQKHGHCNNISIGSWSVQKRNKPRISCGQNSGS